MSLRWKSMGRVMGSLILATGAVVATAHDDDFRPQPYSNHVLVSDGSVPADNMDANLKNGWGVAFNPQGFVWISDNHTGKSTLYDGTGAKNTGLIVTIPAAPGGVQGSPTGIVFNASTTEFQVQGKNPAGVDTKASAAFLFATEDGIIAGWS